MNHPLAAAGRYADPSIRPRARDDLVSSRADVGSGPLVDVAA